MLTPPLMECGLAFIHTPSHPGHNVIRDSRFARCTLYLHIKLSSMTYSCILQKYLREINSFTLQNSLETNRTRPPDHQYWLPFPTPTVVARRLSCHCLARFPASLAVAAGGLRTGGGEPVPGSLLGSRGGAGYRGQRLVATWLFQRLDFGFCFSGFFKYLL